jgi:hypothetical protein
VLKHRGMAFIIAERPAATLLNQVIEKKCAVAFGGRETSVLSQYPGIQKVPRLVAPLK